MIDYNPLLRKHPMYGNEERLIKWMNTSSENSVFSKQSNFRRQLNFNHLLGIDKKLFKVFVSAFKSNSLPSRLD